MIPLDVPLRAWRNAPFVEEYPFVEEDGSPADLVGCTACLQARLYEGQLGSAKLTLPSVSIDDVTGVRVLPASGSIQITIMPAQLQALPAGQPTGDPAQPDVLPFFFDLLVTDPTGFVESWINGLLLVSSGATYP